MNGRLCVCEQPRMMSWNPECKIHGKNPSLKYKFVSIKGEEHWHESDVPPKKIICIELIDGFGSQLIIRLEMDETQKLSDQLRQLFQE